MVTGYVQTPNWTQLTELNATQLSSVIDSWVNVSIPTANQAMVTMMDTDLLGYLQYCLMDVLELWVRKSLGLFDEAV